MKNLPIILWTCLAVLSSRSEGQTSLSMNLGQSGETITDVLVFNGSDLNATAIAWSRPTSGGTFQQEQLAQWSPGIGVKSEGEAITNVPYVPFYTDNETSYDFVLFVFDRPVEVDRLRVHPSGNSFDRDVSYWLGSIDESLDLTGSGFSDLASFGFGPRIDNDSTIGNGARWVDVNSNTGGLNALLIGARVNGDANYDRFKIQTLEVTVLPVPEPSSLLLVAAALPLCFRRRRAA